jgi:alpha-mannosidase
MTAHLHILLVPHTHWDREWYQTFQQFRLRLVRTVDKLLDILDRDQDFSYFLLDGQTIILDDYLEVRPEQAERLKHYIRSGRILVGPWYVQPDEFLVSGESLIRNLQLGLQRASEFGEPMRVGYVPDTFGHIAQLPQIFQGFSIDNAVFWRGVGEEARQSEFYWEAPDGSAVLVVHLADPVGYSNARQLPLRIEEFLPRVEILINNILTKASTDTLLFMNGSDHLEPQEGLPATIARANRELARLDPRLQQIFARGNGAQAEPYQSASIQIGTLPQYIERVRRQRPELATLQGEMRSSQDAHLLPGVLSTRMWIKQQNAATEHLLERWVEPFTAWAALLGAEYPQGLVTLAWRYLLQNHPHDSICGCSIDQVHRENSIRFAQSQQISEGVLAQALQHILTRIDTSAPFAVQHASEEPLALTVFNPAPGPRSDLAQIEIELPGTLHYAEIVDEQGELMPYRVIDRWRKEIGSMAVARDFFASAVALSGATTPEQLIALAESTVVSALGQTEQTHTITHVHIEVGSGESSENAGLEIMIAPKGRVDVNKHELHSAGQQILDLLQREDITNFEFTLIDQSRETVEFLAQGLPGYGYKTFWLYPRGHHSIGYNKEESAVINTLVTGANFIENEYYRVEVVSSDGTLTITDKLTGAVYQGANRFIDSGDVGDLYTYCPPEQDQIVSTPSEPPHIELLVAGPARATLRVSGNWSFPVACHESRQERSAEATICPIRSDITLSPGVRRVEIHTSIENKVRDHRLRVVFPVSYKVEEASAEGSFEVRTRSAASTGRAEHEEWVEQPVGTNPQKRFVDVSNGISGLGVLNRGLPEYEIIQGNGVNGDTESSAIAITLLRCVEWLSRGDLATRRGHAGPPEQTPEGQCQGQQEFDYALVSHSGRWDAEGALIQREALAFNTPIARHVLVGGLHGGTQPSIGSLIEAEPAEIVVSAIQRQRNGSLLVRVYNPLEHLVEATIGVRVAFKHMYVANLPGEYQSEEVEVTETRFAGREEREREHAPRTVSLSLPGKAIRTLVFETDGEEEA